VSLRSLKALCALLFCSARLLLLKGLPLPAEPPSVCSPGDIGFPDGGERSFSAVSRDVAGDAERSIFKVAMVGFIKGC
jgi:hypothetical protein